MRHQISDKFYFNPRNGEVSDKKGIILFKDETIDWIYQPHDHLPLYIVERNTGLTLYNEYGKMMRGAKNVKNIEVRSDGAYIVGNHRHLKMKGDHSVMSYSKELFINSDINTEVRTKHFIIQKNGFKNEYIFKTISGEQFATGTGYRLADDKEENPKYIVVQNGLEDVSETLYCHHGLAMKDAENAEHILWSKDMYSAQHIVQSPIVIKGKTLMTTSYQRFEHKFPEYYGRMIRRGLLCLTVLATMGGCMIKTAKENAKFNNMPATYLGTQDGYVVFDTDGNNQTIEIKSVYPVDSGLSQKLERHTGETYRISGWRTLMNDIRLERQN